jgi:uncharacterized protein YbjT (DUF2867 family)
MKITVIGATGGVGRAVVERALRAGDEVTAYVRDPAKLGDLGGRVRAVAGELTDRAALSEAIAGADAVVSAVGSSPSRLLLDVPAQGMRNVLEVMQERGVRRLVALSGGAVSVSGEHKPLSGRITSWLVRLMARNVVEAKQREYEVISASDTDWTVVRPPRIVEGPASGRVQIGERLHGMQITQGDVAEAMLQLARGTEFLHRAPYVSAPADSLSTQETSN